MTTKQYLSCGFAVMMLWLPGSICMADPVAPQNVLLVDRMDDDSKPGSLRWALVENNKMPGNYRIEISPQGPSPYVIKLKSMLPSIAGPVTIVGTPWSSGGDLVAIDGSEFIDPNRVESCRGEIPEQFGANVRSLQLPALALIDALGVDISGLEIRNFCIGILINRSSRNHVHDNRFVHNHGAAAILLTGDDGTPAARWSASTTNKNLIERNEFIENSDGIELSRGTAYNLIADNVFRAGDHNLEPSQGIEILWGQDNAIVRNRVENYSDGLQINWGLRTYVAANVFTGNAVGVSITGDGNTIDGNTITGNGIGIGVRPEETPTHNRITQNSIYGNGQPISLCYSGGNCDARLPKRGILLGLPAREHAAYTGKTGGGLKADPQRLKYICPEHEPLCEASPNDGLLPPNLDAASSWTKDGMSISGSVQAVPSKRYVVELFANPVATSGHFVEGEFYLGSIRLTTDAKGHAQFYWKQGPRKPGEHCVLPSEHVLEITATNTSVDGGTSEFSRPLKLKR